MPAADFAAALRPLLLLLPLPLPAGFSRVSRVLG